MALTAESTVQRPMPIGSWGDGTSHQPVLDGVDLRLAGVEADDGQRAGLEPELVGRVHDADRRALVGAVEPLEILVRRQLCLGDVRRLQVITVTCSPRCSTPRTGSATCTSARATAATWYWQRRLLLVLHRADADRLRRANRVRVVLLCGGGTGPEPDARHLAEPVDRERRARRARQQVHPRHAHLPCVDPHH
jgi:hypothetical protein